MRRLVSLQGTAVTAQYYQYGNSSMLFYNNPLTSGDDEKLMDSMILSTNNPTDGCFWVQGLMLGQYEVTIYAMTPNDPTLLNRTRVDNGSPGPVMVGGTWPGHQQAGTTYSRFTVTTTDGVIGFHDGLAGGVLQSGMNGVQLRFLGSCPAATISSQPVSVATCHANAVTFSVGASSATTMGYQWQWQVSPLTPWADLTDGVNTYGGLPAVQVNGSHTASQSVRVLWGLGGNIAFRCNVSNACGTTASSTATLTTNSADFNGDGDVGTDADIEDFFACLSGNCCATCGSADFNGDGDVGTDADIEAFFRVLAGGGC